MELKQQQNQQDDGLKQQQKKMMEIFAQPQKEMMEKSAQQQKEMESRLEQQMLATKNVTLHQQEDNERKGRERIYKINLAAQVEENTHKLVQIEEFHEGKHDILMDNIVQIIDAHREKDRMRHLMEQLMARREGTRMRQNNTAYHGSTKATIVPGNGTGPAL